MEIHDFYLFLLSKIMTFKSFSLKFKSSFFFFFLEVNGPDINEVSIVLLSTANFSCSAWKWNQSSRAFTQNRD